MTVAAPAVPVIRSLAPARAPGIVLAVVAAFTSVVSALADPGHGLVGVPELVLLAVRTTTDLAVLGTIGCLVVLMCLPQGPASPTAAALTRTAAAWAGWWTLLLAGTLVWEVLAPSTVVAHTGIGPDASDLDTRLRWLVVGVVLAAATRILARSVRGVVDSWVVLGVATAGLVPAAVTGHGAGSGSVWLVTGALFVHVLAVCAWAGGLLALVMHARGLWSAGAGPVTVRAFSRVALVGFVGVAASGVVAALARGGLDLVLSSPNHAVLLGAKVSILVLLGVAGVAQRKAVLPRLAGRGPAPLVLMAAGELVLMAAAVGLAVTLTHTAG